MGISFSAFKKTNKATAHEESSLFSDINKTLKLRVAQDQEATSYTSSLFVQTGPGGLALRNTLIMEKIVSFLGDMELGF